MKQNIQFDGSLEDRSNVFDDFNTNFDNFKSSSNKKTLNIDDFHDENIARSNFERQYPQEDSNRKSSLSYKNNSKNPLSKKEKSNHLQLNIDDNQFDDFSKSLKTA